MAACTNIPKTRFDLAIIYSCRSSKILDLDGDKIDSLNSLIY